MRFSRVPWPWSLVGSMVLGAASAACDGVNDPPPAEVRVEAITGTSLTGTVGTDVKPAPAVRVTDELDRPVAGVVVTFRPAEGSGTVPHSTVTSGPDGTAAVGTWTLGPKVGSHTLAAGVGARADVFFTAAAAAGPIAQLTPMSGMDQIAGVGESLASPLLVQAADGFGNPLAGLAIEFTVLAGGGSIAAATVVTDPGGRGASGVWTLGAEAGTQEARAAAGTIETTFRATALPPPGPLEGRIAFESLAEPDIDIAIVNADGSGIARLHNRRPEGSPAWSPDGSRLAFGAYSEDEGSTVYTMTATGSDRIRATAGPHDGSPAWSPDGSTIAFTSVRDGANQIAALDIATGSVAAIVDGHGWNAQPAWSPDGRQLAFVSDYTAYDFVYDIYVVNADGSGRRQLTHGFRHAPDVHFYFAPAWSPDGSMIAFVHGTPIRRTIGRRDMRFTVELMSPDGGVLKTLAWAGDIEWEEPHLYPGGVAWSPDGTGIAYTFRDCDLHSTLTCTDARSVKYVSLDGRRELTIVADAANPSWTR
jgi:Tol biopolymer transport system component